MYPFDKFSVLDFFFGVCGLMGIYVPVGPLWMARPGQPIFTYHMV